MFVNCVCQFIYYSGNIGPFSLGNIDIVGNGIIKGTSSLPFPAITDGVVGGRVVIWVLDLSKSVDDGDIDDDESSFDPTEKLFSFPKLKFPLPRFLNSDTSSTEESQLNDASAQMSTGITSTQNPRTKSNQLHDTTEYSTKSILSSATLQLVTPKGEQLFHINRNKWINTCRKERKRR
jgi:hypothetical protein